MSQASLGNEPELSRLTRRDSKRYLKPKFTILIQTDHYHTKV